MKKNHTNNFLVFAVFHPNGIKYFKEFILNFKSQSKINDLFITFNNVVPNLNIKNMIDSENNFKIITYSTDVAPGLSRIKSFKKIIRLNYKYVIFLDCDDLMDKKRCEKIAKEIKDHDFLVNNLIPFKRKNFLKKIIKKKDKKIYLKEILDRNFIGNSTLTIKLKCLKKIIKHLDYESIAFDWCIATNLLLKEFRGIYLGNIITFYRQHNQNVHKKFVNKEKIIQNILIKKKHYEFFKNKDQIFIRKLKNLNIFEKKFLSNPKEYSKKKYENHHKWWIL